MSYELTEEQVLRLMMTYYFFYGPTGFECDAPTEIPDSCSPATTSNETDPPESS